MITLDQIKQLDIKVRKAIDKINSLTDENKMLQTKLDDYQLRIEELEILMDSFKEDQGEIESGIIETLNQLKFIDDENKTPAIESEIKDQEDLETNSESEEKPVFEQIQEDDSDTLETNPEKNTVNDTENNASTSEPEDNSDVELDIF